MATIRKRGNSYQIRVSCGYALDGQQIVRTKTWTPDENLTQRQTEKELKRISVLFEQQCAQGLYIEATTKFAEFAELWIKDYAEKQLKAKTVFTYRNMLATINEHIGHIRLDKIQPHHLLKLYSDLSENGRKQELSKSPSPELFAIIEGLGISKAELSRRSGVCRSVIDTIFNAEPISHASAQKIAAAIEKPLETVFKPHGEGNKTLSNKTVQNFHRLVSSILETAVNWQIIVANPCRRVQPPKVEAPEPRYLNEEEAAKLLEALSGQPLRFRAMITTLLYSGMRRAEILGLTWADVDFVSGVIDINKSSLYLPDKGIFDDSTKSTRSQRVIKLPEVALAVLREWKAEQNIMRMHSGTAWRGKAGNASKVFTRDDGQPLHPDTLTAQFSKFIKENNLPSVCVHSLRHTNATLLIASGVNVRTISNRLGHAQTSTTMNIYAHAIRTADEAAADSLADILTPTNKKKSRA